MPKTKTTIILEVDGLITVSDEGYMGIEATVKEHIDRARRDMSNWRWFVKKGSLEPEPVIIKAHVKEVRVYPGDDAG